MDTSTLNPIETVIGQSYCITTDTPCSVLAKLNGRMMTLLHVRKGQAVFIAPSATVFLTADAHVTKSFKGAAPSVQGGGEYEIARAGEVSPGHCVCEMSSQTWAQIAGGADSVCLVTDASAEEEACSMILELAPEGVVMPTGWLTAQTSDGTPAQVRWIAAEPTLPASGLHYIIGLTQRTPTLVLANLLATY